MTIETLSDIGTNGAKVDAYGDVISGKVQQMRGRLQESWGALTDSDADRFRGRRDQLIGMLQEKYGLTRVQALDFLNDFVKDAVAQQADDEETADLPLPDKETRSRIKTWFGIAFALIAGVMFWQSKKKE